jgi:hypothetical protein
VSTQCNTWRFGVAGSPDPLGPVHLGRLGSTQRTADSLNATATATLNNVILNVRTFYFTARATRDLVEVAQETLKNQISHQQQVEGFVRVGTRPEIDLALARLNVANARVLLITAQNNDRIAKAQLNQAMGLRGTTDYQVAGDELAPVDVEDRPLPFLFDQALSSRPELVSFEYARQASGKALDSAKVGLESHRRLQRQLLQGRARAERAGGQLGIRFHPHLAAHPGRPHGRAGCARRSRIWSASTAALTGEQLQVRFDVEQAEATLLGNKETVVGGPGRGGQREGAAAAGRGAVPGRSGYHHRAERRPGAAHQRSCPAGARRNSISRPRAPSCSLRLVARSDRARDPSVRPPRLDEPVRGRPQPAPLDPRRVVVLSLVGVFFLRRGKGPSQPAGPGAGARVVPVGVTPPSGATCPSGSRGWERDLSRPR